MKYVTDATQVMFLLLGVCLIALVVKLFLQDKKKP